MELWIISKAKSSVLLDIGRQSGKPDSFFIKSLLKETYIKDKFTTKKLNNGTTYSVGHGLNMSKKTRNKFRGRKYKACEHPELFCHYRYLPDDTCKLIRRKCVMRNVGNDVDMAKEHHKKHGDMDGETCMLGACALHYPTMFTHISDETVGDRWCIICGTIYHGKHSECPHGDRTTSMLETL